MKKAVVFYGSMRELALGSKSWHALSEDVDYFLVTWNKVNAHYTDNRSDYPFDISSFPVPVKASIVLDFDEHYQSLLSDKGLFGCGMLYILYHWSLIRELPGISDYDNIIITRTDTANFKLFGEKWIIPNEPGKICITGNDDFGLNDWLLTTDPTGLNVLYDLYHNGMETRDFLRGPNDFKIIHAYLLEKAKANPDKFRYTNLRFPVQVLIRPNYPEEWLNLEYGPEFAKLIIRHAEEYELPHREPGYDIDKKCQQILNTIKFN